MYHLLVVDDEPTLVDGLCEYLRSILSADTDILKAYSGQEAYSIISQYSIDLLILDIQMPGMTGLELVDKVELCCSHCSVILLTSHCKFEWAQEALRHSCCVDYVLKTQGDRAIGEAVLKQIKRIETWNDGKELIKRAAVQLEILQPYFRQKELFEWLVEGKKTPEVTCRGIHTKENILVCLWQSRVQNESIDMYYSLISRMLEDEFKNVVTEVVSLGWGTFVVLIQPLDSLSADLVGSYLYMRLERIQTLLRIADYASDVAFLDRWTDCNNVRQDIKKMHKQLMKMENAEREVIIRSGDLLEKNKYTTSEVLQWIKQYVKEHIDDYNLSLITIAEMSCYSPGYLSRLFKQKEGINLQTYITQVRVDVACALLREGTHNVQEVGKMVGFASSSYFVAYFKRNVGKTPQQYMREERWRKMDESSC